MGVEFGETSSAAAAIDRVLVSPRSSWKCFVDLPRALRVLQRLPPEQLGQYGQPIARLLLPSSSAIVCEAVEALQLLPPEVTITLGDELDEAVAAWQGLWPSDAMDVRCVLTGVLGSIATAVAAIHPLTGVGLDADAARFLATALRCVSACAAASSATPDWLLSATWEALRRAPLDERLDALVTHSEQRDTDAEGVVAPLLQKIDTHELQAHRDVASRLPRLIEHSASPSVVAWAKERVCEMREARAASPVHKKLQTR